MQQCASQRPVQPASINAYLQAVTNHAGWRAVQSPSTAVKCGRVGTSRVLRKRVDATASKDPREYAPLTYPPKTSGLLQATDFCNQGQRARKEDEGRRRNLARASSPGLALTPDSRIRAGYERARRVAPIRWRQPVWVLRRHIGTANTTKSVYAAGKPTRCGQRLENCRISVDM